MHFEAFQRVNCGQMWSFSAKESSHDMKFKMKEAFNHFVNTIKALSLIWGMNFTTINFSAEIFLSQLLIMPERHGFKSSMITKSVLAQNFLIVIFPIRVHTTWPRQNCTASKNPSDNIIWSICLLHFLWNAHFSAFTNYFEMRAGK